MGASCCVASRDKPENIASQVEVSAHLNVRHSPSWSFRWDNRTHIEVVMENTEQLSSNSSVAIRPVIKGSATATAEVLPNSVVPQASKFFSVVDRKINFADQKSRVTGQFTGSFSSPEGMESIKLSGKELAFSDVKTSISVPSTPLSSAQQVDLSCSKSHSQPFNTVLWRKVQHSPGNQLYRQVSDSKIPSLKSHNGSSSPEGGLSPSLLSVCGNDMSTGGSQRESSDGWSMRTFSELVASSLKERCSVDSELLGSATTKESKSVSLPQNATSSELEVCQVCLKMFRDRAFWMGNGVPTVAVMACGHAYHADCLDRLTEESEKYDPPCPVCIYGEKCVMRMFSKIELKLRNKITSSPAEAAGDGIAISKKNKSRKGVKGATSSSSRSPFDHPFLKRNLTIGPGPSRSSPEGESSTRRGFWGRHWR